MTTRVVNLSRQKYDVRIDRRTSFGNPYCIGRDGNRAEVIAKHMADWRSMLADENIRPRAIRLLQSLKDKRLGCHCKPLPCHGDNYVALIAEVCP